MKQKNLFYNNENKTNDTIMHYRNALFLYKLIMNFNESF